MNMKLVEQIAKEIGWYPNQKGVAKFLDCSRQHAVKFLNEHSIAHHRISSKSKSYFLDDIIKAVEKTRWKS